MIPSVRNSLSQHLAVFEEANCDIVYYTPEMEARMKELQKERQQLQAYCVEDLDDHIQDSVPHYNYDKNWSEARTDPILVAHSSGSTGKVLNHSTHHEAKGSLIRKSKTNHNH